MMSDDLVKRLRDPNGLADSVLSENERKEAADRIEELEAAFANISREYDKRGDRIELLEADLARSVYRMQRVKDFRYDPNIGVELNMLEATLAELTGGKNE